MAILIPFYLLKIRGKVEAAKTSAEREKLIGPMRELLKSLFVSIKDCKEKGFIEAVDAPKLMSGLERLYDELFGQYKELAEEGGKMKGELRLWTDDVEDAKAEKIAKRMLERGADVKDIVHDTGLSMRKVKSLMKQQEEKKIA
jgi:hypothetical protein